MEAEQIDKSKENIQPLRQGRVSNQLSEALLAQANINLEIQYGIQQKIQDYELALRTYEGDDPLEPWFEYINWVEQYFPKHGKEGNFPKLLHKCLALFKDTEMYKEDPRYVSLWIKYLEMQPESPSELYEMALNHGIGVKVAQFYHSWAMEMIKMGDMRRANQVYNMGIAAGAEPIDELEQAHKNFQFMVMRKNIESGEETLPSEEESVRRSALNRLESSGMRNSVPHERAAPLHQSNRGPLQFSQPPPAPVKKQTSFSLFKDENNHMETSKALPTKQSLKSFPSSKAMQAENTVEAARWTDCASHKTTTAMPQLSTPFKLHEDSVAATPNSARRMVPNSVLHVRKAQELPEWSVPLFVFEAADPSQKHMYCKDKVYAGGTEFSLEELRAQRFFKIHKELANKRESNAQQEFGSAVAADKVKPELREIEKLHLLPKEQEKPHVEPKEVLCPEMDDFKSNQKIMFLKVFLAKPEISIEEQRAKTYMRRRKEWQDRKAREAREVCKTEENQTEACKVNQIKLDTTRAEVECKTRQDLLQASSVDQNYKIPATSKLCVTYETLVDGVEYSLEELHACYYMKQAAKKTEQTEDFPVVHFEPPNPHVRHMFPINKVYSNDTEYSLEELKAMLYFTKLQLQNHPEYEKQCLSSTSSGNSSKVTTPSSTPGHLSMLGQSMTVNTKEAMAAMKDLWCSRVESPSGATPSQATPFSIFFDSKPSSAPFSIFSTAVVPVDNVPPPCKQNTSSKGPRRGLQLTSELEHVLKKQEMQQFEVCNDEPAHYMALVPLETNQTQTDTNNALTTAKFNFNIYQQPSQANAEKLEGSRKSFFSTNADDNNENAAIKEKSSTRKPFSVLSTFDVYQEPKVEEIDNAAIFQTNKIKHESEDVPDSQDKQSLYVANFGIFREPVQTQETGAASIDQINVMRKSQTVEMSWGSCMKQEIKEEYKDVSIARQEWSVFQEPQQQGSPVSPPKYEIPYVPPPPDDIDCVFNEDEDVPNKENLSPSDYQLPTETRVISGVLVEAQDIPFIPLEEQERMMEEAEKNEDMEMDYQAFPTLVDDVTALTSVFKPVHFSSSTPYHEPPQSILSRLNEPESTNNNGSSPVMAGAASRKLVTDENQVDEEGIDDENEEECPAADRLPGWDIQGLVANAVIAQSNWETQDHGLTAPRNAILSPILEMTGESRGSRSGSSSSSCSTGTMSSLHGFSKTPGQFSLAGDSRFTFSKTPGQFSVFGDKTPGQRSLIGDSYISSARRPLRLQLLESEEEQDCMAPSLNMPEQLQPMTETQNMHKSASTSLQYKPMLTSSLTTADDAMASSVAALSLKEIDPFCVELQAKLLNTLSEPLYTRRGFIQYDVPLPHARVAQSLPLGNRPAKLRRSLGEGAYAKVYKAQVGDSHKVLKVAVNDVTCWDFYISSEIQRRMTDKAMATCFSDITATYLHTNGVIYEMDFQSNVTMLDVVNYYKKQGLGVPMEVLMYFTAEVLRLMHTLHSCNIIHADIKPDNFLLIPSKSDFSADIQLIDFGRCIDMRLFPESTTFLTKLKSADFRCVEMRTNKPWTYQLDMYAAAATIHVLLFGKYMNLMESRGKWVPTCKPKRFWDNCQLLEEIFETLLNIESCDKLPDLLPLIKRCKVAAAKSTVYINKELTNVHSSLQEQ